MLLLVYVMILFAFIFLVALFLIFLLKATMKESVKKKLLLVFISIFSMMILIIIYISISSKNSTIDVEMTSSSNLQLANEMNDVNYMDLKEDEISEMLIDNYTSIKSINVSIEPLKKEFIGVLDIEKNSDLNFENLRDDIIDTIEDIKYIKFININGVVINEYTFGDD